MCGTQRQICRRRWQRSYAAICMSRSCSRPRRKSSTATLAAVVRALSRTGTTGRTTSSRPSPKIPGHEEFQNTDVPCVYQLPGQPDKWYMSFIGFDGQGYNVVRGREHGPGPLDQSAAGDGLWPERASSTTAAASSARFSTSPTTSRRRACSRQRDGKFWTLYGCYPAPGRLRIAARLRRRGLQRRRPDLATGEGHSTSSPSRIPTAAAGKRTASTSRGWSSTRAGSTTSTTRPTAASSRWAWPLSTDLLNWKRYAGNPVVRNRPGGYDEQFCSDGKVFRDGDHWVMFYFGVGHGGAHIMAAFSRDLLHWTAASRTALQGGRQSQRAGQDSTPTRSRWSTTRRTRRSTCTTAPSATRAAASA